VAPTTDLAGCTDREQAGGALRGLREVAFRVTGPDGVPTFDGCAQLADTPATRGQGLMGQRTLGGYDAMVFRFDGPSTGGFYMFRTLLPLSIAFIGEDGGVVSTADMEPCPAAEPSACPSVFATGPYVHAVEVEQGGLPARGIVPRSHRPLRRGEPTVVRPPAERPPGRPLLQDDRPSGGRRGGGGRSCARPALRR
jgi:uncharacterized membrane protein (UPF0127 family)